MPVVDHNGPSKLTTLSIPYRRISSGGYLPVHSELYRSTHLYPRPSIRLAAFPLHLTRPPSRRRPHTTRSLSWLYIPRSKYKHHTQRAGDANAHDCARTPGSAFGHVSTPDKDESGRIIDGSVEKGLAKALALGDTVTLGSGVLEMGVQVGRW